MRGRILLFTILALTACQSRTEPSAEPLEPGRPKQGHLAGGAERRFALELPADRFVRIEVRQNGVDLEMFLADPSGKRLAEERAVGGTSGTEVLELIPATAGTHTLRIKSPFEVTPRGEFEVTLYDAQGVTPERRVRVLGLQQLREGHSLAEDAGGLPEARKRLEAAAHVFHTNGEATRLTEALSALGRVEDLLGDHAAARRSLRDALGHASTDYGRALAAYRLAGVEWDTGNVSTAMEIYAQSAAAAEKIGAALLRAKSLHNIGASHLDLDEPQAALEWFTRSRSAFENLGDHPLIGNEVAAIGAVHARLGNRERALAKLKEARQLLRAKQMLWDEGTTLQKIGVLHLPENPRGARDALTQALAIHRKVNDTSSEASALTALALAWETSGECKKALGLLDAADALHDKAQLQSGRVNSHWIRGRCHRAGGRNELARTELTAMLTGAQAVGSRTLQARAHRELAVLDRDVTHARAAVELIEDLRLRVAAEELRLSLSGSMRPFYDVLVDVEMDRNATAAWEAAERARARTLRETLRAAGANVRRGVPRVSLDQLERAERLLKESELRHLRGKGDAKHVEHALRQYQDVLARVQSESPDYVALTRVSPVRASDVQRLLPGDTAVLEYSLGRERSFAWVVTRSSLTGRVLPAGEEIEKAARGVHAALTARNAKVPGEDPEARARRILRADEAFPAAAAALAAQVLHPLQDELAGKRRLLIVADGALHYVPFAALPLSGASLVEKFEVTSLPSAGVLHQLELRARRRRPAGGTLAVIADPAFEVGTFAALPQSKKEADQIAALATSPWIATGKAANRDAMKAVSNYRLVHLASHGVVDSVHPELSGIALSDGLLRMHDIYDLELAADLVVLSACETAIGKEVRGEGLIGLTRGFLHAGASGVVASLWQVHDRGTAELMTRFYSRMLRDGQDPAEALRGAQRSMAAEERWASPYYWAPFVLQGSSRMK